MASDRHGKHNKPTIAFRVTINALACADAVLIPVQAAYLPVP